MTQEDKGLLLKDLCAKLPYRVNALISYRDYPDAIGSEIPQLVIEEDIARFRMDVVDIKPYLRSVRSITEEEFNEYNELFNTSMDTWEYVDWMNAHHFDYRGLIGKGLALEATEGMY